MRKIVVIARDTSKDKEVGRITGMCRAISQHIWDSAVVEGPSKKVEAAIKDWLSQGYKIWIYTGSAGYTGGMYKLDYITA